MTPGSIGFFWRHAVAAQLALHNKAVGGVGNRTIQDAIYSAIFIEGCELCGQDLFCGAGFVVGHEPYCMGARLVVGHVYPEPWRGASDLLNAGRRRRVRHGRNGRNGHSYISDVRKFLRRPLLRVTLYYVCLEFNLRQGSDSRVSKYVLLPQCQNYILIQAVLQHLGTGCAILAWTIRHQNLRVGTTDSIPFHHETFRVTWFKFLEIRLS